MSSIDHLRGARLPLRFGGAESNDHKRARLAEIDRELARLQYHHDIAMSAFRFEEATTLGRTIAALEKERQALAANLPPPASTPERPTGVVPVLARPRRRR